MLPLSYFIIFLFINLIFSEKVCPSYGNTGYVDQHSCFDQCSPHDDHINPCESNKKCCFVLTSPCGHRCIVPKDDKPKFGRCPSPNCNQIEILWTMCDVHLCDVDNDCPNNQKCCSNRCHARICLTPIITRKKHDHVCDASFCDADHECSDVQKCCVNPCGSKVCVIPN